MTGEEVRITEEKRNILKKCDWRPTKDDLPPVLPLFSSSGICMTKIREFCPDNVKDNTCPKPTETIDGGPASPHEHSPPVTPHQLPQRVPSHPNLHHQNDLDFVDYVNRQDITPGPAPINNSRTLNFLLCALLPSSFYVQKKQRKQLSFLVLTSIKAEPTSMCARVKLLYILTKFSFRISTCTHAYGALCFA